MTFNREGGQEDELTKLKGGIARLPIVLQVFRGVTIWKGKTVYLIWLKLLLLPEEDCFFLQHTIVKTIKY